MPISSQRVIFPTTAAMFHRFLFLLLFFPLILNAQRAIPPHNGIWVHDEAGVLSAQVQAELETILKAERDSTSNQIAVLIIPSLDGEAIEDYAIRVAHNEWKLGDKDKDNGVLLLIVVNDRKVRIETGYGLEGVLTDAMSSRINRNEIAPYFRQGDYDNGVKAGVIAIMQAIKGEYKNDAPDNNKSVKSRRSPITTIIIIIIILLVVARNKRGGGRGGYWSSGGGFLGGGGGFGGGGGSSADFGGGGGFGGGGSSDSW